jgi:hypothetical protein
MCKIIKVSRGITWVNSPTDLYWAIIIIDLLGILLIPTVV